MVRVIFIGGQGRGGTTLLAPSWPDRPASVRPARWSTPPPSPYGYERH